MLDTAQDFVEANGCSEKTVTDENSTGHHLAFRLRLMWFSFLGILFAMTQAVAHILNEVQKLSPAERAELRHAIVEHIPMSGDLTEDDYGALAAASFRALDEEEAAGSA